MRVFGDIFIVGSITFDILGFNDDVEHWFPD